MSKVKITLLGTGTSQGVPLIGCKCKVCLSDNPKDKRLRTSALVQTANTNVVIDTGPDFRQQMLRTGIDKLDAVIFTHEHKDHTAGLDDIRAFNFIQKKAVPVYANKNVQHSLRREFAYIFEEKKYPGIPEITLTEIEENQAFQINDLSIMPFRVMHMYLPVIAFKFNDICYITDANFISEETIAKIRNVKILVLNALRYEKHPSHFTLDEAVEIVKKINPEKAYFTHISHQLGLHEEISSRLPENIFLAYDGLVLE